MSDVFADSKDFVVFLFPDTFRIQGILLFPCFWTLSVFKGFCRFPVSRHFPYSRNFVVFPFPDTFRNQWPPCHSVPPVCFVVAQKMLSLPLFKVKTNLNRNTIRIQIRNPHSSKYEIHYHKYRNNLSVQLNLDVDTAAHLHYDDSYIMDHPNLDN